MRFYMYVLVLLGLFAPLAFSQTDGTVFNEEAEAADTGPGNVRAPVRDHSVYEIPRDLGDGLQVGSLAQSKADAESIMEMVRLTAEGQWKTIDSILILQNGTLLFEDYFNNGHMDEPHTLMSITKSVTACLVGIALEDGLIRDLQDPLIDYFPHISADDVDPSVAAVTVHDVLTSRSGLQAGARADKPKSKGKGVDAESWDLLTGAVAENPGGNYRYGGVNTETLGLLLTTVNGKSLSQYAEETLFKELGIETYKWKKGRGGVNSVGAGLDLRSRDMMKIGLMVIQNGEFNGRQVLTEDYVTAMTGTYHSSPHMGNYGFLWWSTGGEGTDKPRRISGRGAKGQFIFIRPDLDLVAVFTASNRKGARKAPFEMFEQYVVPAFHSAR